jgi:hypothetical protein
VFLRLYDATSPHKNLLVSACGSKANFSAASEVFEGGGDVGVVLAVSSFLLFGNARPTQP